MLAEQQVVDFDDTNDLRIRNDAAWQTFDITVFDRLKPAIEERHRRQRAKARYRAVLVMTDLIAVTTAVITAQTVRFGGPVFGPQTPKTDAWVNVTMFSAALVVVWLAALGLQGAWDIKATGRGVDEYRRVINATIAVFGGLAVIGLLVQQQMARGYLAIALPLGLFLLVIGRHAVRSWLAIRRTKGEHTRDVLILGEVESAQELCASLSRVRSSGYRVVGVCLPGTTAPAGTCLVTQVGEIPVFGDENAVEKALVYTQADTLAVAALERLGHSRVRKLAWKLEDLGVDMIVVPGMTDVAGPRLRIEPVDHLPVFHVGQTRDSVRARFSKRVFDIVVATMALVVFAPVMIVIALAVMIDDGMPVLFRQTRVGYQGRHFRISKFRTMSVNADRHVEAAKAAAGQVASIFYKSADDARITSVGRFLRRTSLDELPQLFNVLSGSMSIVGPRPLVPGEADTVEDFLERRSLVKPGMTGLWQISGRSDLPEEDRIRLDHSYVDNWSFVQDVVIVWRTARSVIAREGAY